ncbi:MAG: acyltransferase, partial [Nostocoides sp.]
MPLRQGLLGVDVFFVISGYLITGILIRELDDTGTISWGRFLARRIRRLLPAAVLVLAATAVVAWFVVPGLRRVTIGADVAGAALYVVNWVFAHRAVDYLSADATPSPVQNYWSLSVEEQFYVLWPLALIAVAWLGRRVSSRSLRPAAIAVLLAAISVPSFAYAAWLGHVDPARSYFVTTTRAWELGVGAALALAVAHSRLPDLVQRHPRLAAVAGWAGLVAILATAYRLPTGAVWPGPWTLLPTLGAAAVLASGLAGPRGPGRLLGTAPMVWIGGLSYSLYLWHWPALVLTEWAVGPLTTPEMAAVMALAVLPAWASLRLIERPIHHSTTLARRVRPVLALGVSLSAAGALVGLPLATATSEFRTTPASGVRPAITSLGAGTMTDPPSTDPAAYAGTWDWVTPDPERAGEDRPAADVDHCQVDRLTTVPVRC